MVETADLYGGDVIVELNEGTHRYKVDGQYKLGVTTVCSVLNKPELLLWPLNECISLLKAQLKPDRTYTEQELESLLERSKTAHTVKSDKGKDAGTITHEYIEQYLTGHEPGRFTGNAPADNAISAFHQFLEQFDPQLMLSERIIYSKQYDYCGKFDLLARIGDQVCLIDFKTNNRGRQFVDGIYPEHFIQLGGYSQALEEETDILPDLHMVVNLDKKSGSFRKKSRAAQHLEQDTYTFLDCLNLYRGLQELRKFVMK